MSQRKRTSRLVSTENWHGKEHMVSENWHGKDTFVYADVTKEEDVKVS